MSGEALERIPPAVREAYEQNIGMIAGPWVLDPIVQALENHPEQDVIDAITAAAASNVRRWPYVAAILERWAEKGRPNAERERAALTAWNALPVTVQVVYREAFKRTPSDPEVVMVIANAVREYGAGEVIYCIGIAYKNKARSWRYVEAVLRGRQARENATGYRERPGERKVNQ